MSSDDGGRCDASAVGRCDGEDESAEADAREARASEFPRACECGGIQFGLESNTRRIVLARNGALRPSTPAVLTARGALAGPACLLSRATATQRTRDEYCGPDQREHASHGAQGAPFGVRQRAFNGLIVHADYPQPQVGKAVQLALDQGAQNIDLVRSQILARSAGSRC